MTPIIRRWFICKLRAWLRKYDLCEICRQAEPGATCEICGARICSDCTSNYYADVDICLPCRWQITPEEEAADRAAALAQQSEEERENGSAI